MSHQHNTVKNEALMALTTLGFDKSRVEKTLEQILDKADNDYSLEALIKQALQKL